MKNKKIIVVCVCILAISSLWQLSDPYAIKQEISIDYPYYVVQTVDGLINPYDQSTEDIKYAQDGNTELTKVDYSDNLDLMDALSNYSQDLEAYVTYGPNGCSIRFIYSNGHIEDYELCTDEASVITDSPVVTDDYIAVGMLKETGESKSVIHVLNNKLEPVVDINSGDMVIQVAISGDTLYYMTSSGDDLENSNMDNKIYQYDLITNESSLLLLDDDGAMNDMNIIGYDNKLFGFYSNPNKIAEGNTLVQEFGQITETGIELIASDLIYMDYSAVVDGDLYFWGYGSSNPFTTVFKHSSGGGLETVVNLVETESLYAFSNNGFITEGNEMYTIYDYEGNVIDGFELENEYKSSIGKDYSYYPIVFV